MRTLITQGDPTGIGPELIVRAAAEGLIEPDDLIFAGEEALESAARALGALGEKGLEICRAGCALRTRSMTQTESLSLMRTQLLANGMQDSVVTAPIDKAAAVAEGFAFPGHTEFFAELAGKERAVMMMAGSSLRVALVTVHCALSEVPGRVSASEIAHVCAVVADALQRYFQIEAPRIGVLALNPHAGEKGMFGNEEARQISPGIAQAQLENKHATIFGPLSGDSAFYEHRRGHYDALVAMYHDQGLGPFKTVHFSDGVNMTLGLPFLRTSPDHGTAKNLVGTGRADLSSFRNAILLAKRRPLLTT